jgi:transcriptional regulator with XRE-family HTH domain
MRKHSPLRNIRRARTLNQEQIAGLLGGSQQTYSKYESGRLVPTTDVQERLAALLGVGRAELFPESAEAAR